MGDVRVWFHPDGQVAYSDLSRAGDVEAEWAKILAARGLAPDTEYVDMDVTALPSRDDRHKWRKHPTDLAVVVDTKVPDPPNPKQAMLDEIDQAATLDDVKVLLRKLA